LRFQQYDLKNDKRHFPFVLSPRLVMAAGQVSVSKMFTRPIACPRVKIHVCVRTRRISVSMQTRHRRRCPCTHAPPLSYRAPPSFASRGPRRRELIRGCRWLRERCEPRKHRGPRGHRWPRGGASSVRGSGRRRPAGG
jgi:hypothetical protein